MLVYQKGNTKKTAKKLSTSLVQCSFKIVFSFLDRPSQFPIPVPHLASRPHPPSVWWLALRRPRQEAAGSTSSPTSEAQSSVDPQETRLNNGGSRKASVCFGAFLDFSSSLSSRFPWVQTANGDFRNVQNGATGITKLIPWINRLFWFWY